MISVFLSSLKLAKEQSTVMSGAPCFPFTCGNLPVLSAPIFLCVVRSQQQTSPPGGE